MRANRYVSYLGAEIEPKAISTLTDFERATARTFANIENLSSRGQARMGLGTVGLDGGARRQVQQMEQQLRRARAEVQSTGNAAQRAGQQSTVMATGFTRAAQALNVVQGPLGPLAGRLSALGNVFQSLSGFTLAGVLGGGGAFALGSIASQYQNITDRLRPLYDNQTDLNRALSDVVGIAGRTRQALEPVAEIYSRITLAGREAGLESRRLARLSETVAKAARLSGGSAQTQEAGLTQFAQGFGSGILGGEELRSVRENTLRLAQAIAQGLDVPMAKLKELGAAGVLTPELIAQALERSAAQIEVEFARLPKRIGTSLTELSNNFSVFIGRVDETTGATAFLANSLSALANNLGGVIAVSAAALTAFNARAIVGGMGAAVTATSSFVTAQRDAFRSQMEFNRQVADGTAGLLYNNRALQQHAAQAVAGAKQEVAAVQGVIAARRQDGAQLRANLPIIEQQITAQTRQLEIARRLDAASRSQGGRGRPDLILAANADLRASMQARVLTQQALANADRVLATAEGQLAAATGAVTAAQQRLDVVMAAAPARVARLSAVSNVLNAALTRVAAASASLVNFLGGPWGVAFATATTLVAALSAQTDVAADAARRFHNEQDEVARKLGGTSAALQQATADAREYARAMAQAGVQDAQKNLQEGQKSIGGTLSNALLNFRPQDLLTAQGRQDFATIRRISEKARTGRYDPREDFLALREVQRRRSHVFEGDPFGVSGYLGGNPQNLFGREGPVLGVRQLNTELERAKENLADVEKNLAKPRTPAPKIPEPRSAGELAAEARRRAARTDLEIARADLAKVRAGGRNENETEDAYIDRLAQAERRVKDLVAAEKAARAGRAAGNKAERERAAALRKEIAAAETLRDKMDALADIRDRYTEDTPVKRLEKLRDGAEKAKREVDDLLRALVAVGKMTPEAAEQERRTRRAEIDDFVETEARRPVTDVLQQAQEEIAIQREILAGRSTEAEFLRQKFDLQKRVGDLLPHEHEQLLNNLRVLQELGDAQEKRNQQIEVHARLIGDARQAARDLIREFVDNPVRAIGNFAQRIREAFLDATADELAIKLFGDPEKAFRDEMTRGLNNSASRLDSSASALDAAADALGSAAGAIETGAADPTVTAATWASERKVSDTLANAAGALSAIAGTSGGGAGVPPGFGRNDDLDRIAGPISGAASRMDDVARTVAVLAGETGRVADEVEQEIVVTGSRRKAAKEPGSVADRANALGRAVGTAIAGPNSVLTRALGSIGSVMQFMAYGQVASGIGKSLGLRQSKLGAQLGSVAGSQIGYYFGGKEGAKVGAALGGFWGGTVGGAIKGARTGSATLSNLSGDFGMRGSSGKAREVAEGAAKNVSAGLQRIADTLGGDVGAFRVSIGTRDGKFRVDPSGQGRTKTKKGAVNFGKDEEAATRFAILDALKDGAIQGIREGSKRLLQAGKDLEVALNKALKFEDVFRRLKRFKDPMGAAVDDVNREFQGLIKIFKEAGASATEFRELEELYGFERAEAIKQATNQTIDSLSDFIQGLTSGPESPLGRRRVYENARAEVDKFRGDIAAGKVVDSDKLITALENLQSASGELHGSRAPFFRDFDDILALAEQARTNAGTRATGDNPNLPPSPFADPELRRSWQGIHDQTTIQTDLLHDIRDSLRGSGGGGSTIDLLPGVARDSGAMFGGTIH